MKMYKNKIIRNKFPTPRRNDIHLIFERKTKIAEQFSGAEFTCYQYSPSKGDNIAHGQDPKLQDS